MSRCAAVLFFCLFLLNAVYAAADPQKAVEQLLSSQNYTSKGIGVVITDLQNDSVLVNINGEEMLNPASVMKLVTGAAAFELLGSDYHFNTGVYIDGNFDSDSGIVNGNLYLKGEGDPGFSAERLWLLVQHLGHLGVKKITGNLVLDDFFFDSVTVGPGYEDEGSSRAYDPLISALSASFNTVAIHNRSGKKIGSPVHVDIFPKIEGVNVVSNAKTVSSGKKSSLDVQTISTEKGTNVIVRGSMSLTDNPKYIYRKVWQTWETFGGAILALFEENKIKLEGQVVHEPVSDSVITNGAIYNFVSEPVSKFIANMFKYSSNFAAEMLFKTIAAQDTVPGSWDRGAEKISSWWENCKLPGKLQIRNGAGMGNVNKLSAAQVAALLSHVWSKKSYMPEYLSSLSVSGIDGTLKARFKRSPLKGVVRGKTGTLNSLRVSNLAGYLLLENGDYAFAIICNGMGKGQYDNWVMQERILEKFTSEMNKH